MARPGTTRNPHQPYATQGRANNLQFPTFAPAATFAQLQPTTSPTMNRTVLRREKQKFKLLDFEKLWSKQVGKRLWIQKSARRVTRSNVTPDDEQETDHCITNGIL